MGHHVKNDHINLCKSCFVNNLHKNSFCFHEQGRDLIYFVPVLFHSGETGASSHIGKLPQGLYLHN